VVFLIIMIHCKKGGGGFRGHQGVFKGDYQGHQGVFKDSAVLDFNNRYN